MALIDLGLPGLDGYEVARRIRAVAGSTMRLVALTGYGELEDRDRTADAGFDLHLLKPVHPDRLLQALVDLAGEHPNPAARAAPALRSNRPIVGRSRPRSTGRLKAFGRGHTRPLPRPRVGHTLCRIMLDKSFAKWWLGRVTPYKDVPPEKLSAEREAMREAAGVQQQLRARSSITPSSPRSTRWCR